MATQQGFAQQFPDRRLTTRLGKPAFSSCPVPWPELFHRSNPTVIREPHKSFATVCCAFQKKQWNQHITFTDNCTQNTLIKPEHAWTNSKGHRKPQETEHALPLRMWFNWFSSTVSFKHAQLDCLVCCPIVITHTTWTHVDAMKQGSVQQLFKWNTSRPFKAKETQDSVCNAFKILQISIHHNHWTTEMWAWTKT